ncbi:MAG: valine--tRNA ligase [Armatimonadota bacterium]
MDKQYDPKKVEAKWYEFWQSRGYFRLTPKSERPDAPGYCITIPPPNVTGSLHMGHALQHSIHDCIARWRRLCGDRVLVVPGTDHAAISTNMKVEQLLADEGISRHDLGREKFLDRCWEWTRKYGGQIIEQLKALGCSYDWDRTRFTLDDEYYRGVQQAFIHFHERGWLYRGHRVVNWCPTCDSTVSDLEVEHRDHEGKLWHIMYPLADGDGGIVVATTRPETMLGDTAVAVNSEDPRYARFHGKQVILPLMNRRIPVICDDTLVDPSFGTGAVKVTPAHDLNDFEAGERNGLPSVVVIGTDARMTAEAGQYAGLDRYEARERIVADLTAQGLLVKIEDYTYSIGRHDRCHTTLEPLLSEQWFLRMAELARMALDVIEGEPHPPSPLPVCGEGVDGRRVTYVPDRFRGYTVEWLKNLRDWNISRQIWWGHRIPAYFCKQCGHTMVQVEQPAACADCGGAVEQDPDTLDTWFSSALWPFAVLGWPDAAKLRDSVAEGMYPTSLMITARDILYLWIVRMIMTGLEFAADIPFREVLVHATVLDIEGRRMSKSLGTGVDPLELIANYGSDATRFSLLYQCAADQDIRFGEERTEMARNFCNKIWNASRFVLTNLGDDFTPAKDVPALIRSDGSLAERWILSRFGSMLATVDEALHTYEMAQAARALYTFFWSEFCDWFVEVCKPPIQQGGPTAQRARQALWFILEGTLRALHPFMPFISEEIWQQLPGAGKALIAARWPSVEEMWSDLDAEREFDALMQVVVAARKLRADQQVPPGQRVGIRAATTDSSLRRLADDGRQAILLLARGSEIIVSDDVDAKPAVAELVDCFGQQCAVWIERRVSREEIVAQRKRVERELERLRKDEASLAGKLESADFEAKAPERVRQQTAERLEAARQRIEALRGQVRDLDGELSGEP